MKEYYLNKILKISEPYLKKAFSEGRLKEFLEKIQFIYDIKNRDGIIKTFSNVYISFIKEDYQRQYQGTDKKLNNFINKQDEKLKRLINILIEHFKQHKMRYYGFDI